MAELKYFLVVPDSERETAIRRRLSAVGQTRITGVLRLAEPGGDFQGVLVSAKPDVFLVDPGVPKEKAFECAVRARGMLPRLVTVVMLPLQDFAFVQAAVNAGIDATLVEPVDFTNLVKQCTDMWRNRLRTVDWPSVQAPGMSGSMPAVGATAPVAVPMPPAPEPKGPTGTVLAFISGKDGEGKTTVAMNLAFSLAAKFGKRVIYLDLSDVLSDTSVLLNAKQPGSFYDLMQLPPAELTPEGIKRYAIDYKGDGSVLAICGNPSIEAPRLDRDRLDVLLRYLRTMANYLVLDCPVRFGDILKVALKLSDWHVAVVQNTLSSLRNTRLYLAELKRLEFPPHQVRVVLNRVSKTAGLARDDIIKSLEPYPVACSIVSNGPVALECSNIGVPIMIHAPESDIAESIHNLAKALQGIESSDLAQSGFNLASMLGSLFGR